jgi:Tol biopolymer transport system component
MSQEMDFAAFRLLSVVLLAASSLLAFAPSAHATFAGENGRIAFVRAHTNENEDIYTVNADGTGLKRLTNNEIFGQDSAFDLEAQWSPDGRKILFYRVRGTDESGSGAFTMNADGSDLTQLTGIEASVPTWLPNGRVAFFISTPEDGLYTVNPDGSELTRVGPNLNGGVPAWSPDGSKLAFARWRTCCGIQGYDIYTANLDGSGELRIAERASYPVWSPSNKIAFIRDVSGCCQIYTIDPDGTDEIRLTNDNAVDLLRGWSPNGTSLLFMSNRDATPNNHFDIFTINADGSGRTNLTPTTAATESYPAWSPDGKRVVFNSLEGSPGGIALHTIDTDGTHRTRITDDGVLEESDNSPDWQPLLRSSFTSSAAFCRAQREAVGQERFAERWSGRGNRANAFGKCVSGSNR